MTCRGAAERWGHASEGGTIESREGERSVAVIGDVVRSRRFEGAERERLQRCIQRVVDAVNATYGSSILSQFVITTGDEFQGLLCGGVVLPDVIADVDTGLPDVEVRIGIGFGRLETELRPTAVGMDGPVWHRARAAIEQAGSERRLGGVFRGFGADGDTILNGFARLTWSIRSGWTDRQREVVRLLAEVPTYAAAAERLDVTRQAVAQLAHAASWPAYDEGMRAWRAALAPFDDCDAGDRR